MTLAATDRFRLAVREFDWRPETPDISTAVLVPARTLADAAKTLTGGPESCCHCIAARRGPARPRPAGRQTTTRLLDVEFVKYRSIMPTSHATAVLPVGASPTRSNGSHSSPSAAPHCAASSPRVR